MKRSAISKLSRNGIEELLYHALRTIYLFERAEIDQFDLNYQQMYLLKLLKRKSPYRVSEIAAELRIPVFAATRLVSQLDNKSLVVKNRDLKDRRNIFVGITADGKEMLKRIETHIIDLTLSSLGAYSAEQAQLIVDVVENLDVILGLRSESREAADSLK